MKRLNSKLFGIIAGVVLTGAVQAQNIIYKEDFEGTAANSMPAGFKILNKDGQTLKANAQFWPNNVAWAVQDGNAMVSVGNKAAMSSSYYNNTAVAADKWMITPQITLTNSASLLLKWDVFTFTAQSGGLLESYDVLVSTTDTALASFTHVLTSITNENDGSYVTKATSLAAYAGQNIYIAFHYKSLAKFIIAIDNITVADVPANDAATNSITIPPYIQKGNSFNITGVISNQGSAVLNTVNINWSANGGTVNSQALSGLNIAPFATATFTHNTAVTNPISGSSTLKVWVANPDNSTDAVHSNDTITKTYAVLDTLVNKKVLVEEFNQASCDPCANATPNLDAALDATRNIQTTVRYHVNFPGRDFINEQTQTQVGPRVLTYYAVQGVPDGKIDGSTDFYPGNVTPNDIQNAANIGSPIKISASYQLTGNTHTITAAIKSYMALPAGLKAFAAIIDSLHFNNNQSTETIPQYDFPQSMEELLPSTSGTALTAFTAGQTQSVTFTWAQTHRLATKNVSFPYDSGHFQVVVFIQDYTSKYVYQSLQVNANGSSTNTVGIENNLSKVQSENTLAAYPNPFNQKLSITLNLAKESTVKLEIFNLLGQKVYEVNKGTLGAGTQQFEWNANALESGIYMIKATTGDKSITQKVTLLK